MLVFAIALGIALLCILLAPRLLTLSPWQIKHPRTALGLWFTAFFLGAIALFTATFVAVYAGVTISETDPLWWSITLTVLAWISLGVAGGFIGLVLTLNEPLIESQRRKHSELDPFILSEEHRGRFSIATFTSDEPLAYALPGQHPKIFVSTALKESLNRDQLQAVLAHEYAHLHQRHNWAMRITEVNALCLPFFRASGHLRRATLLLVELIADDTAARQVGPAPLANALTELAALSADPGMEMRAERIAQYTWPKAKHRKIPDAIKLH